MEQRDFDMTVALMDRHISDWNRRAREARTVMDTQKEVYHQCTTARDALESVRNAFVCANS